MNKLISWLVGGLLLLPMLASASMSGGSISRGGLGFLFPDNNSFENPAQFAKSHGVSLEAGWEKMDQGSDQDGSLSAVWGNGKWGLGAYGNRNGDELTPSDMTTQDTVGAGFGVMLGNRVSLGAGYNTTVSAAPPDKGTVDATVNVNPMGDKGFAVGVGGSTNISPANGGRTTQTGTVALGYQFRYNTTVEVYGRVNDFANATDDTGGLALTLLASNFLYLGGLAEWNRLASDYDVAARVGFILGRAVDLSVLAAKVLETGAPLTYGATLRVSL